MDTVTDRLVLHPLSVDEVVALSRQQRREGELWAPGYPSFEELGLFQAYALDPAYRKGWVMHQLCRRDTGMVIGGIGLIGRNDGSGDVEIGFEVAPSMRGAGYATEAVRAIAQVARDQQASRLVASTGPAQVAAQHVLIAGGFTEIDSGDEAALSFELRL